jgi:hypothetical protein
MTKEILPPEPQDSAAALPPTKTASSRSRSRKKSAKTFKERRKRTVRPYPASSFQEALTLAQEILKHAPDGKIRRLTYLKLADRSGTSSSTQMLITNSSKYNITKGSYVAEWLEVTPDGLIAASPDDSRERLQSRFNLAVEGIPAFKSLYEEYKSKRIPSHEVMKDFLKSTHSDVDNITECLDLFIVNAKFLGLLQTIAGSETLVPVEHVLDELKSRPFSFANPAASLSTTDDQRDFSNGSSPAVTSWETICFYMSPIGEDTSEQRQHSDLFLNHLVEPALQEFGLKVVRADLIGESGMITSQILEHILKSKLVIADLSFQNPNVFYELAIRHACRLPIVQIIRKSDKIPFDVDQVRTIQIDNSGIYALIPKLETYRSEIATHVRQALASSENVINPLTLFCPGFEVSLPT